MAAVKFSKQPNPILAIKFPPVHVRLTEAISMNQESVPFSSCFICIQITLGTFTCKPNGGTDVLWANLSNSLFAQFIWETLSLHIWNNFCMVYFSCNVKFVPVAPPRFRKDIGHNANKCVGSWPYVRRPQSSPILLNLTHYLHIETDDEQIIAQIVLHFRLLQISTNWSWSGDNVSNVEFHVQIAETFLFKINRSYTCNCSASENMSSSNRGIRVGRGWAGGGGGGGWGWVNSWDAVLAILVTIVQLVYIVKRLDFLWPIGTACALTSPTYNMVQLKDKEKWSIQHGQTSGTLNRHLQNGKQFGIQLREWMFIKRTSHFKKKKTSKRSIHYLHPCTLCALFQSLP